jgi:hypothetical protein
MTATRRHFVSTLAFMPIVGSPLLAQRDATMTSDPLFAQLHTDLQRIHDEIITGTHGRHTCRALESALRYQAALLVSQGFDAKVKAAVGRRIKDVGRDHLVQEVFMNEHGAHRREHELQRHFPKHRLPPQPVNVPTIDVIHGALSLLESEGVSGHFMRLADAIQEASGRAGAIQRVQYCGYWSSMNNVDNAMLTWYCGFSYFLGTAGQVVCALWAMESGMVQLLFYMLC